MKPLNPRLLDATGLTDGNYVLEVAGGKAVGLTPASVGGGGAVDVQDENTLVVAGATVLDFQGAGVAVTAGAVGEAVVTIPGGGGAGGWTKDVDLPLTTLTDWAAAGGTWTAAVDHIKQTLATAATVARLHYGPRVRQAQVVAQVDIRIDSAAHTNTDSRAGIVFGTPRSSDGNGGAWVCLASNGTQVTGVNFEVDAVAKYEVVNYAAPVPHGTWQTMKVHKVGLNFDVFVDGTLITSFELPDRVRQLGRLALKTYGATASFRNLKVWTPDLPVL